MVVLCPEFCSGFIFVIIPFIVVLSVLFWMCAITDYSYELLVFVYARFIAPRGVRMIEGIGWPDRNL